MNFGGNNHLIFQSPNISRMRPLKIGNATPLRHNFRYLTPQLKKISSFDWSMIEEDFDQEIELSGLGTVTGFAPLSTPKSIRDLTRKYETEDDLSLDDSDSPISPNPPPKSPKSETTKPKTPFVLKNPLILNPAAAIMNHLLVTHQNPLVVLKDGSTRTHTSLSKNTNSSYRRYRDAKLGHSSKSLICMTKSNLRAIPLRQSPGKTPLEKCYSPIPQILSTTDLLVLALKKRFQDLPYDENDANYGNGQLLLAKTESKVQSRVLIQNDATFIKKTPPKVKKSLSKRNSASFLPGDSKFVTPKNGKLEKKKTKETIKIKYHRPTLITNQNKSWSERRRRPVAANMSIHFKKSKYCEANKLVNPFLEPGLTLDLEDSVIQPKTPLGDMGDTLSFDSLEDFDFNKDVDQLLKFESNSVELELESPVDDDTPHLDVPNAVKVHTSVKDTESVLGAVENENDVNLNSGDSIQQVYLEEEMEMNTVPDSEPTSAEVESTEISINETVDDTHSNENESSSDDDDDDEPFSNIQLEFSSNSARKHHHPRWSMNPIQNQNQNQNQGGKVFQETSNLSLSKHQAKRPSSEQKSRPMKVQGRLRPRSRKSILRERRGQFITPTKRHHHELEKDALIREGLVVINGLPSFARPTISSLKKNRKKRDLVI